MTLHGHKRHCQVTRNKEHFETKYVSFRVKYSRQKALNIKKYVLMAVNYLYFQDKNIQNANTHQNCIFIGFREKPLTQQQ